MRASPEKERFHAITLLYPGYTICEVLNYWASLNLHAIGFVESVLHVELARGGRPRNIALVEGGVWVRAITVGGLDNVVAVRNALNEHLNVVVSTNTVGIALHEVGLWSLEKQ